MRKFDRIFLVGFRATGKSTLGKLLADKLNWSFIDLDFLISQQEGKDIGEITNNGKDWKKFREIENEALKDISKMENVVISCGGGVGVNDIVDEGTKKTFGILNEETLKNNNNLIILLTSQDEIIKKRLEQLFKRKKIMPFINSKNANEKINEKVLVAKQVEDSMQTLIERKPLYETLADLEIDTSNFIIPKSINNLFAIIGFPVYHSLSPKMHNRAYKSLGIEQDNLFISIRVKEENLEDFIEVMKLLNIKGVSVTIPYKETIMKYLDKIDETAKKIGAVNTILNVGGKLVGYNTDWVGAITALEKRTNLKGKKVAVIGAGGAARGIVFGLVHKGAKVKIFNRTEKNAKELADEFGAEFGTIDDIGEIVGYDVLINATSVGLDEDKSPIPADILNKDQIVFDVVYSPKETQLLKEAKEKGAEVVYGYEMLLYQGTEQFKMYTGFEAPVKDMEKAILEGLN